MCYTFRNGILNSESRLDHELFILPVIIYVASVDIFFINKMVASILIQLLDGTIDVETLKIIICFYSGSFRPNSKFSFHEILLVISFNRVDIDLGGRKHAIDYRIQFHLS